MESGAQESDSTHHSFAPTPPENKADRSRLRKAVERLGWKWVNRSTVEVRYERELKFGLRSVVVRGRVPIDIPTELTLAAGERAVVAIAEPAVSEAARAIARAGTKILSEPDDVEATHVFERSSFFTALEDARRALLQTYQLLENRRVTRRSKPSSAFGSISKASARRSAPSSTSSGRRTRGRPTPRSSCCERRGAGSTWRRCGCSRSRSTNG
jgi:hypothetical protein